MWLMANYLYIQPDKHALKGKYKVYKLMKRIFKLDIRLKDSKRKKEETV